MIKKSKVGPEALRFKQWLQDHYVLRSGTLDNYTIAINAFIRDYRELTYNNCSKFLLASSSTKEPSRNYARKYALQKYITFKGLGKLNVQLESLYKNIRMAGDVRHDKEITDMDAFTAFVQSLDPRLKTVMMVMMDTGCRIQAILALTKADVRTDKRGTFIILHEGRKVKKTLNRYVEDTTARKLKAFMAASPSTYPFRENLSQGKARYALWSELKNKSRKAGLVDSGKKYGISFHWLRTTRAREVYRKYKDLIKVKTFLGHANIGTTMRYVEPGKDESYTIIKGENKW
jgi:integrase